MENSLKKGSLWISIMFMAAMMSSLGCGPSKETSTETIDVPLVKTMTINSKGTGEVYTYSGEVRGRYENQMAFQIAGKIIRRNVDLGSIVRAGDVLMQIDPIDIQQSIDAGKAQVSAAESQYGIAKENRDRFKILLDEGLMSKAEFDKYQNAYDSAEAMLKQANAQYTLALNQFGYSNLTADRPGVVSAIYAEAGQVVAAGQPIVALVKGDEREIEISVPENRIKDFNADQVFKVTFWALQGVTAEGKVREVSPVADPITRTYKARIGLENPPSDLKLGMTATVTASEGYERVGVYVPISAVYQTGDSPMVWVVDRDVVTLQNVKIGGFEEGDQVQVLEGLKDGDIIVTAGVHRLNEGEKVRVQGENK